MAICYHNGESPPNLPIVVTVRFDSYRGPTLSDGTVPITPLRRTWSASGGSCSCLQLPLKLAWAITIHKAQGITLNKVVIDVRNKEFSAGLTFVACLRVRCMNDLFDPTFPFQRVANLANSRLQERLLQDTKLLLLDGSVLAHPSPQDPCEAISSYMSFQLPMQTPPSCSSTPPPPPMDSQAPTPTPSSHSPRPFYGLSSTHSYPTLLFINPFLLWTLKHLLLPHPPLVHEPPVILQCPPKWIGAVIFLLYNGTSRRLTILRQPLAQSTKLHKCTMMITSPHLSKLSY